MVGIIWKGVEIFLMRCFFWVGVGVDVFMFFKELKFFCGVEVVQGGPIFFRGCEFFLGLRLFLGDDWNFSGGVFLCLWVGLFWGA